MESRVSEGDYNFVWLSINGNLLQESRSETMLVKYNSVDFGAAGSTGGRMVTVQANTGDQIELRATKLDGAYYKVLYCLEYLPKI